mmetsp:Transcript_2506/g.5298  ORF Transcript_2506/g.5298 Transcript_2506/m.5298 type:complete len:180 (+) Transcript_2506:1212-1751(+)
MSPIALRTCEPKRERHDIDVKKHFSSSSSIIAAAAGRDARHSHSTTSNKFDWTTMTTKAEDNSKASDEERLERLTKEAEERNAKKQAAARTICTIDIKPSDVIPDEDLVALWKKITASVTQDGLVWGEKCALEPVAFGIKKIVTSFTMGTDNSSEEVIEAIEAMEDDVQSADITSMNVI